ncbi:MAG: PKD domain-containing protein [Anaerolineae bacterium]
MISLAPSQPPAYAVNSALADTNGGFAVDLIVPSDPRWLDESPVPIIAAVDGQNVKAQAALTIIAASNGAPVATAVASSDIVVVAAVPATPPPPLPPSVAQLATTANLNVRSGPGTSYDVLGVLLLSQQAEIIGRNADATWWQVKFAGAKQGFGWVSAQFAQANNIGNVPIVNAPAPPPPPAPPAQTPPDVVISDWRGEYFNNKDLSGSPVFVRNDPAISFDWGLGSPDPRIPNDYFSVRWTRNVNFSAGTYRFYTRVDDGVRLWVDGALLINQWREQSPVTYAADIYLGDGGHDLRMEWNELTGGATAILSWERVDTFPDWKVEYYNNPNLQGAPVLVRNEGTINHNWGQGSPGAGVPADNFSARWTRSVYLDGGDYLFRIQSDDGHRMWVDNDLIFDNWRDGSTQLQEARRNIPAGLHQLRVEYYERSGAALIGFAWQRTDRPQTGPLAVIRAPDDGLTGQPVTFDGRRSREGDSKIDKYEWDFGDGSRTRGDKVSHTYNTNGTYRVTLTVTDRNGLRDKTRVDIRINSNLVASIPPVAIIDAPSTGQVGQPVNFSGQRSSSVSPIVGYRWNFADGGSSQDTNPVHTFNAPGTYSVSLTVIGQNGLRSSDNVNIRIDNPLLPSAAPVAKISAPAQGQAGQAVSFDASQSTASSPIVSWLWNFGDGATADGLNIPHAYANPGTYNVTLTVTDQNGQSNTANQLITIATPAA